MATASIYLRTKCDANSFIRNMRYGQKSKSKTAVANGLAAILNFTKSVTFKLPACLTFSGPRTAMSVCISNIFGDGAISPRHIQDGGREMIDDLGPQ